MYEIPSNAGRNQFEIPGAAEDEQRPSWADVPWRTIIGSVGVVVATYVTITLVLATGRILTWVVIAGSTGIRFRGGRERWFAIRLSVL